MKELNILQLGKFYPMEGGVEKVAYDLTCGLSERGLHCDWMCATLSGSGDTVRLNGHSRIIRCHTWTRKAATMIAPSKIAMLRKICGDYDIIHIHHPDPMAATALRFSGYRGRVVLHWHSDIERQKFLLKLYMPLQDWLLRRADIIVGTTPVYIAGSPYLMEVRDKTVCIPIGVSPVTFDRAAAESIRARYGNRKIVFSLGRLVPYKGFTCLIEAACHLPDDYVILIGGEGGLKEDLEAEIHDRGIEDKVFLLGRIGDEELPAYYGACTLFCLPSVKKTEAFGIVQIEAMSIGRPVVATEIPQSGVPWVNADGESGLNVPPGDAVQLAGAIMAIAGDSDIWARFSERAHKRYEDMFTKEKMIDNCLKIYEQL